MSTRKVAAAQSTAASSPVVPRIAGRKTPSSRRSSTPRLAGCVDAAPRHLTEENQNRHGFKAGKDLRTAKEKKTGSSSFKAGRDL